MENNSTFNLPNITGGQTVRGVAPNSSAFGNTTDGSLPKITGKFSPWGYQNQLEPSGVFYQTGTGTHAYSAGDAWVGSVINFDASRSSSAYSRTDNKVIAYGTHMYYIIKY